LGYIAADGAEDWGQFVKMHTHCCTAVYHQYGDGGDTEIQISVAEITGHRDARLIRKTFSVVEEPHEKA
jgi:hypothetical protein